MIEKILNISIDNTPFLKYRNDVMTRRDFVSEVERIYSSLRKQYQCSETVYIAEENPLHFYPILFALWLSDMKVVFPTKFTILKKSIPLYASQIATLQNNNLINFAANTHYSPLLFDGDTVVFSSGSTGIPKGIVHDKNSFFLNAKSTTNFLKAPRGESLTFLKPYLVSALSHTLVHWLNRSTLHFADYEKISEIFCSSLPKRLNLVGSPIHIISSIKFMEAHGLAPYYFLSSGDMIADGIVDRILQKFSQTVFYKVYGLAEVAGRLFINTITKSEHISDIGMHLPDAEVSFFNEEVVVEAPYLFYGYIRGQKYKKISSPFYTGDKVLQTGSRTILVGRKNDEVKVAGNKVSLKFLENRIVTTLKQLDDIEAGFVLAIAHPYFGNILALVLAGKTYDKKSLVKLLKKELATHEIPHLFYTISPDQIPYTQSMKIDRSALCNMIERGELKELI